MKIITKIFIVLIFSLSGNFVLAQQNSDKEKEQLKQVDIDFSNLSLEKGMNHAFLSFAADDGVLLRPNSYPMKELKKSKRRWETMIQHLL